MAWIGMLLTFGLTVPLGLDQYIPTPDDNPLTRDKVELGRSLFHDKRLSRDGTVACASCHESTHAFADNKALAEGIAKRVGTRRSPTLINRAFGRRFFWDGRVATLEEQVLQPIENPKEMDLQISTAVERLADQRDAFRRVFGREPNEQDLAKALASYVRTILAGGSAYDRFVAGEESALSVKAREGLRLFRGKAGCIACHVGSNFTDERLHHTGAGEIDRDKQFKTPTLREVARRAPYMHDGSIATLAKVVDFYDEGGKAGPSLDPEMRKLGLTAAEKAALVAFLEALSGEVWEGWR